MLKIDPALTSYRGAASMNRTMRRALRPRIDYTVSSWADARRKLSPKHAKQSGRWKTSKTPYLREPMDNLSARSRVRITTLMKGAQLGGTEIANNWLGYRADGQPAPMLYVLPTLTILKRTSARLQRMVDDDPKGLGRKILPARQRDSKNSEREKHYPGGAWYLASAQSATNLRSTMVEGAVFDEVDAYPADVDGEGSVIGVGEGRGGTIGDDWKQLEISTPLVSQTSLIKVRYEKGDQRKYCMPCPHCASLIDFHLDGFKWEQGNAAKTIHFKCEPCGGEIFEARHKRQMIEHGVWVPKVIYDDKEAMARLSKGDRTQLDAHNETAFHRSYYMPSFLATIGLKWSTIFTKWDEAAGNVAEQKTITNIYFGLPWVAPGEAPPWERVMGLRNKLRARELPLWTAFLTAGIDVGIDHVEVYVYAWGRRKHRHLVEKIRIDGPYNEPTTWAQVDAVIERCYLHPFGAVLPIRRIIVDRNKWPDVVDPWLAKQNPWIVIGQRGSSNFDHPIFKYTSRRERASDISFGIPSSLRVLTSGVSLLKMELYGSINLKQDGRGEAPVGTISLNADTDEETCRQIVSERLEFHSVNGRRATPRWQPLPNTRHEGLDCTNYARVGAEIEGISRWSEADFQREEKSMREQAEEDAEWLKVEAHRRQTAGDDRPVTLRDRYPNLVMPGDEDPILAIAEAAADEADAADQTPDQAPVATVPSPVPTPADRHEDPEFPGLRATWDTAAVPRPAQAHAVGAGIVRCKERAEDFFAPVTVSADI